MVKWSFKDLTVWQKSVNLSVNIYELTAKLPNTEKFGLSSQLRRAAVAIPSNIAEGYRRNNRKEYIQFCGIALGSAAELETQLIIISESLSRIGLQRWNSVVYRDSKNAHSTHQQIKSLKKQKSYS